MGNCCIKKFIEKSGRTCERFREPHKNRKNNYSKDCQKAIKKAGRPCEKCERLHRNRKDDLCCDCREMTCRLCFGPKNLDIESFIHVM